MKKTFVLLLMCVFSLCGYAQRKLICDEICGIRFGESYEIAKEKLEEKFEFPIFQRMEIIFFIKTKRMAVCSFHTFRSLFNVTEIIAT